MWYAGHVFNTVNGNVKVTKRADSRVASQTDAFDEHVRRAEAVQRFGCFGSLFSRDLGSLMELLEHLDGYALRTQRAVTIPLIRSMLENE